MHSFPLKALVLGALFLSACHHAASSGTQVASIQIAAINVAEGQTSPLTAALFDSKGKAVSGVTVKWSIGDVLVATVDGSVLTGMSAGTTRVIATAVGATGSAVVTVGDGGGGSPVASDSTAGLIDAALANGTIDAETALADKIFAMFKDPRLAAELQGNDEGVFESDALMQLNLQFDQLSEQTQTLLAPFLVRPAEVGSWLDPNHTPITFQKRSADRREQKRPSCGGVVTGWNSVAPFATPVKVWYEIAVPGQSDLANTVANELDKVIWKSLITDLKLATPLSDEDATGCHGGDARVDFYLVDLQDRGDTQAENIVSVVQDHQSPVYVLLNRGLPTDELLAGTTHELMHAIQWAYKTKSAHDSYGWMKDATADWAIDHVYKDDSSKPQLEKLFAPCYMSSPDLPLDDRSTGHCKSPVSRAARDYGSYLFFQFLEKTAGEGVVKAAVEAVQTQDTSIKAVDTSIPGGFKKQWPLFAKLLWNQDPVDVNSFHAWDNMNETPKLQPNDAKQPVMVGSVDATFPLDTVPKPLAIHYYHFLFPDASARSVAVQNNPRAIPDSVISSQAFRLDDSSIWSWEDWTIQTGDFTNYLRRFCRDAKAERLKELVVVFANADTEGRRTDPGVPTELDANNVGCWRWKGTTSYTFNNNNVLVQTNSTNDVIFERDTGAGAVPQLPMRVTYNAISGNLAGNFTEVGTCTTTSSFSGHSVLEASSGATGQGQLMIDNYAFAHNPLLLGGAFGPRQYTGEGSTIVDAVAHGSCPDGSTFTLDHFSVGGTWFGTEQTTPGQVAKVDASGNISGHTSFNQGGISTTYDWNLSPLQEP